MIPKINEPPNTLANISTLSARESDRTYCTTYLGSLPLSFGQPAKPVFFLRTGAHCRPTAPFPRQRSEHREPA